MSTTSRMTRKARVARRWSPEPQRVLWQALRNRGLGGLKFRRAAPVGGRVVDFHCPEMRLVVEVTGKGQDREMLAVRDAALAASGLRVLRLRREQVLGDLPAALASIARHAQSL